MCLDAFTHTVSKLNFVLVVCAPGWVHLYLGKCDSSKSYTFSFEVKISSYKQSLRTDWFLGIVCHLFIVITTSFDASIIITRLAMAWCMSKDW